MTASPGVVLEAARVQAGMEPGEVWLAYFALGGMEWPDVVQAIFDGSVAPSRADYDMLAHALNERFVDRGGNHPVPYEDEFD
ncbi:MAG: hypothetical protein ABR511_10495 [Acidimicrobiales bacterium]